MFVINFEKVCLFLCGCFHMSSVFRFNHGCAEGNSDFLFPTISLVTHTYIQKSHRITFYQVYQVEQFACVKIFSKQTTSSLSQCQC